MPQIIDHWSFKTQPANIDVARIFREAPAAARVLRIQVDKFRILAMRKELYERSVATPVQPPRIPSFAGIRRYWTPNVDDRGSVMRLTDTSSVHIPSAHQASWVYTFCLLSAEEELSGGVVRVYDLLDWLNRADAYRDSLVGVLVEAF